MDSVLREFINTLWKQNHGYGKDPLEDPVWIKQFAVKISTELTIDMNQSSEELQALRSVFLEAIHEVLDNRLDEDALFHIIEAGLMRCSGTRVLQKKEDLYSLGFKPLTYDLVYLKSELLVRFYHLIFNSDRTRIRICENPDCQYVFYDDSKNKSKRHCHSGCSNLMKVRRFRDKQKK